MLKNVWREREREKERERERRVDVERFQSGDNQEGKRATDEFFFGLNLHVIICSFPSNSFM